MAGFLGNLVHVGDLDADILGDDVATAEALDGAAHRAHHRGRLLGPVGQDHRLAAAQRQSGQRRLVGHAARQPQHVGQRLGLGGIVPDPAAAKRGTEPRGMDRDDRLQPVTLVLGKHHLFVAVEIRMGEEFHGAPPARMKSPPECRVSRARSKPSAPRR